MTARLLPWAVMAAVIAAFAVLTPALPKGASEAGVGERKGLSYLEIRLWPVDMREFRDDGSWNRLVASEAIYSYADRTVSGTGVTISLNARAGLQRIGESELRAVKAFWDFDRRRIELPDGGEGESSQGWKVNMAPAVFDLESSILSTPGKTSLDGPDFSVVGENLRWNWLDEKIFLDSPVSRIMPSSLGAPVASSAEEPEKTQ